MAIKFARFDLPTHKKKTLGLGELAFPDLTIFLKQDLTQLYPLPACQKHSTSHFPHFPKHGKDRRTLGCFILTIITTILSTRQGQPPEAPCTAHAVPPLSLRQMVGPPPPPGPWQSLGVAPRCTAASPSLWVQAGRLTHALTPFLKFCEEKEKRIQKITSGADEHK